MTSQQQEEAPSSPGGGDLFAGLSMATTTTNNNSRADDDDAITSAAEGIATPITSNKQQLEVVLNHQDKLEDADQQQDNDNDIPVAPDLHATNENGDHDEVQQQKAVDDDVLLGDLKDNNEEPAAAETQKEILTEEPEPQQNGGGGGYFSSWFGGGSSTVAAAAPEPATKAPEREGGDEPESHDSEEVEEESPSVEAAEEEESSGVAVEEENQKTPPASAEQTTASDEAPPADAPEEGPSDDDDTPAVKSEEEEEESGVVVTTPTPESGAEIDGEQNEAGEEDDAVIVENPTTNGDHQEAKAAGDDPEPAKAAEENQVGSDGSPATTKAQAKAGEEEEDEPAASNNREMTPQERQELDEAFHSAAATPTADAAAVSITNSHLRISPDTPVPNALVCLKLLKRFAYKTRPKILTKYGGSRSRPLLSYVISSSTDQHDSTFSKYKDLMDCIFDEDEDRNPHPDDSEFSSERETTPVVVTTNMNGSGGDGGDNEEEETTPQTSPSARNTVLVTAVDPAITAQAGTAVAAFVDLFAVWGHASSSFGDNRKGQAAFGEFQIQILDAASNLVAHGCLDNVHICIADDTHVAAQMLASSVFNSDLSLRNVELTAIKFLLGTGCRQTDPSLLRGSYLLQTIRTLYHIYLTTETESNKTTARAALQQLVTSVFTKVVHTHVEDVENADKNAMFPSEDHRDAFLVLRSICKLSMRNLPDQDAGMHSHIGLQTSASNETWDGDRMKAQSERPTSKHATSLDGSGGSSSHAADRREHAHLIYTSAIHPALESKLLALELILYVLQNTDFTVTFIQNCGAQFHAAIRNYLCVSLLKNCTSDNTRVVSLSLRIFVPVVRNFRTVLKNEIEAFVTNVFFVILDSKNSPAEHKSIVVNTFNEICSDPNTLAEIFLNYDCDLSAVDLFHRIVNTLSRLSRTGLQEPMRSSGMSSLMGGPTEAQMEKFRSESRELRLDAMRALRQILASLHASIVEPMQASETAAANGEAATSHANDNGSVASSDASSPPSSGKQNLVEIYGSKKKRRAEESEAVLRFNQKPSAGIAYAAKCKHIDAEDPTDVARYLLKNKDVMDKTQIGEYLGREPDYQKGFSLRVLHEYVRLMDFNGLVFDDAIRFFLSGFRLPGEAQKIDRIMEKFAERFTEQNPDVFPSADVAFILSFSIIMLNTDLHNPAIKEERRMTKEGFIRNNRGICDGQDLPEEMLTSIFDRIKKNPISLKEDDEARERVGDSKKRSSVPGLPAALSPASFFSSHYDDMDRARETNFQKERDHIVRTTESLLKRRRHGADQRAPARSRSGKPPRQARFVLSGDSGLRDEYVSPMFEVTWGPALAAFSTAMESANGTVGALISIASDEELELAAENAAETIEVCLTGFRFAIGTAGLCGNAIARDAYMLALSRFSQLGTGVLLEPRHVRCVQTLLSLAREDGELLGGSWEHVFKALSEINRFHQLFHLMARNDRAAALAAERRRSRLEEKEERRRLREERRAAAEDGESITDADDYSESESEDDDSLAESGLFSDDDDFELEEDMDAKAIDEANAREIYDAVSEATIEAIYERSSSLSAPAVKEFVIQLCLVSRNEISVGANDQLDLTQVAYRQKHALLNNNSNAHAAGDQFHHTQPNIYNLQKLVEVTHYNMASRPRLIFADLWIVVADHLTDTALHSNPAIAMYAVDSFRQLSIQYLQRDELEVFEFQRRFLKPLETVMARSNQTSTKELLLNCVARLMHVFGTNQDGSSASRRKGGLRSGWVPILTILGLGGCDRNKGIAQMSFKTLSGEIEFCLNDEKHPDVLLSEHFVETVNALLMIIGGPHDEISLLAVDELISLTDALAENKITPQLVRRKSSKAPELYQDDNSKQKLELWWPVLLGLSRSVGDSRSVLRSKSLEALFGIINKHFFAVEDPASTRETLQLIFRGVLAQILEFAETSSDDEPTPGLPDDFELLFSETNDEKDSPNELQDDREETSWLETTYDPFIDACVGICLRSISTFNELSVVEEIFAILNSCLLSDSGALAVRGLRRLEQFVTSDLETASLTDDVWATVSHMLTRCLSVRGLPKPPTKPKGDASPEEVENADAEYSEAVREFISEDSYLSHRRYVGSNATMVIGLLLCSDRFSIGFKWRIFLVKGLGRAINEWDRAADIFDAKEKAQQSVPNPTPDYRDTALYGRKWMNRFLLQLASMKEVVQAPPDADVKSNRFAGGQKLVVDLTQAMLDSFVIKEKAASEYYHSKTDDDAYKRYTALVNELLSGYINMDSDHLQDMAWISPVLLSSCIRSKNEDIRLMVQKLVGKTSPASATPPPPPPAASSPTEEVSTEQEETQEDAAASVPPTAAAAEMPSDSKAAEEEETQEEGETNGNRIVEVAETNGTSS